MFFDDELLGRRKDSMLRIPPPTPDTGWRPPSFPNLSSATVIALDCETKELDFKNGPGWSRNMGHIVGVSLAAKDSQGNRGKWYFPFAHEIEPQYNMDKEQVVRFLKHNLERADVPKVGANLTYDMGWLEELGIRVQGDLYDVQYAEALIDEAVTVNLDDLAYRYLGVGKTSNALYEWCARAYGGKPTGVQRANIWRASPRLVGPYAEDDAAHPIDILQEQWPILKKNGLLDVFRMECGLIPLLIRMRYAGVTVDLAKAGQLHDELGDDIRVLEKRLKDKVGFNVNVNANEDVAKAFDVFNIPYPRTAATAKKPNGAPSFRKEWLEAHEHPLAKFIVDIRQHYKIKDTFIGSYILDKHVPVLGSNSLGIIHCMFNNMRDDDGGAKTGRFSSSYPNLQNIPVRTELGKRVREAFIPDLGHIDWEKNDYSQIEYRMLAHFAVNEERGDSADVLRQTYIDNPKTDYHTKVMKEVAAVRKINLDAMSDEERDTFRKPIKNINFGLLYGQSEKGLAYKSGMSREEAATFFKAYHQGAPYVRATMQAIDREAQNNGFITTILGRRTHFRLWEPINYDDRTGRALPFSQAIHEFGSQIQRAFTYRAVNYRLQGSAAEVIKMAMWQAYKEGVFDVIGFPKLQVHDELDISVIDDTKLIRDGHARLHHILENALPCRIPIKVDTSRGENWRKAK